MSEVHVFVVRLTVPDGTRLADTRRELLTAISFGKPEVQILYGLSGPVDETEQERVLKAALQREAGKVEMENRLPRLRKLPYDEEPEDAE